MCERVFQPNLTDVLRVSARRDVRGTRRRKRDQEQHEKEHSVDKLSLSVKLLSCTSLKVKGQRSSACGDVTFTPYWDLNAETHVLT